VNLRRLQIESTGALADLGRIRALVLEAADVLEVPVPPADLAIATSELATNAMQLEAGPVTVTVSVGESGNLRVEVRDHGGGAPKMQPTPPPGSVGQRGLFIVDALAAAWGVESRPQGKVVWFELAPDPIRLTASVGGPGPSGQG
jgi:anti-sigma regulatory factor (Ser/Thr protein kinase)